MIYDHSTLDGIYDDGIRAWFDRADLSDNPYDKHTEAWYSWREGWIAQDNHTYPEED